MQIYFIVLMHTAFIELFNIVWKTHIVAKPLWVFHPPLSIVRINKKVPQKCGTQLVVVLNNCRNYSAVAVASSVAGVSATGASTTSSTGASATGASATGAATASTFFTTGTLRLSIRAFLSAP
jgi:hypothetical protein